jgi:hypothetical protein
MLTTESLNTAVPLTTVLDNRDLVLTPVTGTPLAALVVATRSDPSFNTAGEDSTEFCPDIFNIVYIANVKDPVLDICKHDTVMDDIIDVVSAAVKEHMVFAKNVVAPAIEELVTATMTTLSELTPSSLLGMEIVIWNPPKPMTGSALETAVRKFEDLPYDVPNMNLRLPLITVSEIIELMKSGSGNMDSDIAEWAAGKGESYFISLWENVFQQKQADLSDTVGKSFREYIYDCEDALDNAVAIFLISRKLFDKPLPETEMNLDSHGKTMVEFRNQSAARLCIAFTEMDKIEKVEQLVRSTTNRVTVVNGSVYSKWIDAGGENETLFGNVLETSSSVTISDINAKTDVLKATWARHAAITATIERNRLFARTKEVLQTHFQEQMRRTTEGEEATISNRETVIGLFTEQLSRVREDELTDIWTICLKLICRSRFARTEAERILLGIERIKKENPNTDIRECAAVSMIEYIAYWVSTQMKLSPL